MKKNVVVIAGGNSSEYDVSIKSGHHVFSEVDGERFNKYLMILRGREWQVDIDGERYDVDKNDFLSLWRPENRIRFCLYHHSRCAGRERHVAGVFGYDGDSLFYMQYTL